MKQMPQGPETNVEKTLFDKYGGFSTVSKIVMSLYDALLEDDDLGPFFDDVDMGKLIDHQTKFVSSLMGGPASFSDEHIRRAHAHLTIEPGHFERLAEIVAEVLESYGVEEADVDAILEAFTARRALLVG